MTQISGMTTISNCPNEPLELFNAIIKRLNANIICLNLASIDKDFGVLNRTVVYRGLKDECITFVTERNTRKYQNLKDNAKVSVTFLFPEVPAEYDDGKPEVWQIRLMDAEALELNNDVISEYWHRESIFAKIRSHISICGAPVEPEHFQQKHDQILKDYQDGSNKLDQTDTYTVFKIKSKLWDFYKSEEQKIADRVQYRKKEHGWEILHVAP